jgi:hypothetical protein
VRHNRTLRRLVRCAQFLSLHDEIPTPPLGRFTSKWGEQKNVSEVRRWTGQNPSTYSPIWNKYLYEFSDCKDRVLCEDEDSLLPAPMR